MAESTITGVRAIITAPAGINLVVVRIDTNQPGLYGLGCATFAWRAHAVREVVETYFRPLLIGRDASRIEDIWHSLHTSAYWRNGPILNNALAGVDLALWDIKGKQAGMPVYDLLGGRCREGVPVYLHASGSSPEAVEDAVRAILAKGVGHVRCQIDGYGGPPIHRCLDGTPLPGNYYDPEAYARSVPLLFQHLRRSLGDEVELLHDVHERLEPSQAIRLGRDLEPYRLFFLEDLLPPEQAAWLAQLRAQCATPIALGELFNHPMEWRDCIERRLIDFMRVHITQIGGLTPARKLAVYCETYGIRTAWHGPPDCSPLGHAANLHLSLAVRNFGIQEWTEPKEALREVFPGAATLGPNGRVVPPHAPGWGIDCDETAADRFPPVELSCSWMHARRPDGSHAYP